MRPESAEDFRLSKLWQIELATWKSGSTGIWIDGKSIKDGRMEEGCRLHRERGRGGESEKWTRITIQSMILCKSCEYWSQM